VVDFLINLLSSTASSKGYRKGLNSASVGLKATGRGYNIKPADLKTTASFEPYPHNLGFEHEDGSQDIGLLLATLDMIPAVKVMAECATDEQLKITLDVRQ